MVLARDRDGNPVTAADLEVAGAMTAWLVDAAKPNLIQTIEGQPVLVHAGPFANIALGQSSIIADRVALKLSDIHVTESGFGAEIGFEKFWNVKCHISGLVPDAAVIVATFRALKNHGGAPQPMPGRALPAAYTREDVGTGGGRLRQSAAPYRHRAAGRGVAGGLHQCLCLGYGGRDRGRCAGPARPRGRARWPSRGTGARAATARWNWPTLCWMPATKRTNSTPLYDWSLPFAERVERNATQVYGADGVDYAPEAARRLAELQERPDATELGVCMVKTQYSLSDDPSRKGAPRGWRLKVRDVLFYGGAGTGRPRGRGHQPQARHRLASGLPQGDVDVETGQVIGLF